MKQATAVRSFRRSDDRTTVKFGQVIKGSDAYIDELARNGLVNQVKVIDGEEPVGKSPDKSPSVAAGKEQKSSVSRAAQASQQTTAKQSNAGGKEQQK